VALDVFDCVDAPFKSFSDQLHSTNIDLLKKNGIERTVAGCGWECVLRTNLRIHAHIDARARTYASNMARATGLEIIRISAK
jgi:hypothetical protein